MVINIEELERTPLYSEELGIVLSNDDDEETFHWFLASLLFGGRISETVAKHTYQAFARHQLLKPEKILNTGLDYLIDPIMSEGGYVRYDNRKSSQILSNCEQLVREYAGSLKRLHETAADGRDLEDRLLAFYGVGPVTVNIFLRELRPFWSKANPGPLPVVHERAALLGIDLSRYAPKTLLFCRVEAGLIRHRRKS